LAVSSAYAYAAKYRDDVQRLVILDVPLEGFGREDFAAKRGLWWFGFFQATDGLAESLVEGHEEMLLKWFFSRAPAAITPADVAEYVRVYSGRDALRSGFEYYRVSINASNFKTMRSKADHSSIRTGQTAGRAGLYSLARLRTCLWGIIPRCGHYIAEEQPEELPDNSPRFLRNKG
jgi:pimeloyl-ACP methyl ester carboxylesterase